MKTRLTRGAGIAVLGAAWVLSAMSQTAGGGGVVREIDDPHSGQRWLLMRDDGHPGGPGCMILTAGEGSAGRELEAGSLQPAGTQAKDRAPAMPVIHTGDRLIVEESTAVVEARLEGVAMGPAAIGSAVNVRLKIGGNVVRAVALGPGRAAFAPRRGVRP